MILDAILGDSTLFLRGDEVEASWLYVDPLLAAAKRSASRPCEYAAGSWGPRESDAMLASDGRAWRRL